MPAELRQVGGNLPLAGGGGAVPGPRRRRRAGRRPSREDPLLFQSRRPKEAIVCAAGRAAPDPGPGAVAGMSTLPWGVCKAGRGRGGPGLELRVGDPEFRTFQTGVGAPQPLPRTGGEGPGWEDRAFPSGPALCRG